MSNPHDTDRPDSTLTDRIIKPGTPVEVRQRLDHSWARGFQVAEVVNEAYRIRRMSDGSVLPAEFTFDDVRKERKKQGLWWY